jgi:signal transduction histidine kinase
MSWVTSFCAVLLLCLLCVLFHLWVFRPLQVLISGSRRVASGEFRHRIRLTSHDEMAELAGAMNDMTARFQEIRDGLDQEVRERTREVVQSERLASVGFLAAGVAHEINNPLAAIAMSADSLVLRVNRLLDDECEQDAEDRQADVEVVDKYLRRIQEESFRCKGITERLLDFSRLGNMEQDETDLHQLASGVIEMLQDLGKYRGKKIVFQCTQRVTAWVNAQEIKQVVLNLITNALDSLDADGTVTVRVRQVGDSAQIVVQDNGCGMTEEVCQHLFEPFFTRRRDGTGTGLGLSITYRIVTDHGGRIEAHSDGPGRGSTLRVTLPVRPTDEQEKRVQKAA